MKKFLDVKIGDIVIASDNYGNYYTEHRVRIVNVMHDKEYITETNPTGIVYGCEDLYEESYEYGIDNDENEFPITIVTDCRF